jgi:hypothetical protein
MQAITTIGLDIAKSVFQVHGVDAGGELVIRRQLKRAPCPDLLPGVGWLVGDEMFRRRSRSWAGTPWHSKHLAFRQCRH